MYDYLNILKLYTISLFLYFGKFQSISIINKLFIYCKQLYFRFECEKVMEVPEILVNLFDLP